MELYKIMLNNYSVLMRDKTGDEGWTQVEGSSEVNAKVTVMLRWGKGWRVAEIKLADPFYQQTDAETAEEAQAVLALRVETLRKARQRAVVTPQGEYESVKIAAAAYKQPCQTFRKRIGRDAGFYFKEVDTPAE
jgi:hypothetical protein